jgi:hypothetical protein
MKRRLLILIIVFCYLSISSALASDSGDKLLWGLTGKAADGLEAVTDRAFYYGYVSGIVDSYRFLSDFNPEIRFICLPKQGISNEQAVQIIVKWLKNHPDRLHEPAKLLVLEALSGAFPCSN